MLNPFILIILGFPIKVGTVLFISSALSTPGLEQDMVTTRVGFVLSSNVRMRDISYQGGCLNWLLVATSMVGWLIHVFWGWNPAICFSDCIWYASIRNMKKVTILYQICVHELLMSIYDVQAMSYWCPNDTQVLTPSGPLTWGSLWWWGLWNKGLCWKRLQRLQCEQWRIRNLLRAGKESTWVQKSPPTTPNMSMCFF